MKTTVPERSRCALHLERFLIAESTGDCDEATLEHVTSCLNCRDAIAAARTDGVVARSGRRRLLRFLLSGAVATVGLGAGFLLARPERRDRGPARVSPVEREYLEFDRILRDQGAAGIERIAAASSEQEALAVVDWIVSRNETRLIGILVRALADTRVAVRLRSLGALRKLDPAVLRSEVRAISAAAKSETDPALATLLNDLVERITRP